ncbi:MAG TPA: hypothetical protein VNJ01_01425 [Bacteriovoracaceae bacterium]|nr:hypothetical protein [Bacteriovoracaceae bacterium]
MKKSISLMALSLLVASPASYAQKSFGDSYPKLEGKIVNIVIDPDESAGKQAVSKTIKALQTQKGIFSGDGMVLQKVGTRVQLENANISGGKISAQSIRPSSVQPALFYNGGGTAPESINVLAVKLRFSGTYVAGCTNEQLDNAIFKAPSSVASFFKEMSRQKITFTGKVHTEIIDITDNPTDCMDFFKLANEADAILSSKNIDLGQYSKMMYILPPLNCGWAGVAAMGGKPAWINGSACNNGSVMAHELGHTLGLNHASIPGPEEISSNQYGDFSDVMGMGQSYIMGTNPINKLVLRYISPSEILTATASGQTYSLKTISPPLLEAGNSVALSYKDAQMTDTAFMSFRVRNGFDANLSSTYLNSLSVHTGSTTLGYRTVRVATLAVGESYTTTSGVKIKLVGLTDAEAKVSVTAAGGATPPVNTCVPALPSLTLPSMIQMEEAGMDDVTVQVKNNDNAYCPSSSVVLGLKATSQFSASFVPASVTLAPQETKSVNLKLTHQDGTGVLSYTLVASGHALGNKEVTGSATIAAQQNVCARSAASFAVPAAINITQGSFSEVDLQVKNNDNAYCPTTDFRPALGASSKVSAEFFPATVSLAPQETQVVKMKLTHLTGADTFAYSVTLQGHPLGNKSASGNVTIVAPNNSCIRMAPVLSLPTGLDLAVGGNTEVDVSVRNNDNAYCAPVDLTINGPSANFTVGFTPSIFALAPQEGRIIKMKLTHKSGSGTISYSVNLLGHPSGTKTVSAAVTVAVAPTTQCVRVTPGLILPVNFSMNAKSTSDVEVTIMNKDSSSCAAVAYNLAMSSSSVSGVFVPSSFSLAPMQTRVLQLKLTHFSGSGIVPYSVVLSGHPSGTSEASSTVTISPVTTLGTPTALKASVGMKCPNVSLSWQVSSGSWKSFEVYRRGIRIGSSGVKSYLDPKVAKGSYTYQVRAIGSDGSSSELSSSVSVSITKGTSTCNPVVVKKRSAPRLKTKRN